MISHSFTRRDLNQIIANIVFFIALQKCLQKTIVVMVVIVLLNETETKDWFDNERQSLRFDLMIIKDDLFYDVDIKVSSMWNTNIE